MYDLYELMTFLCGVSDLDLEESEIAGIFYEKYEINEDLFMDLMADLLPLCTVAQSELTGTWYRGFGADGVWLMKQTINE